MGKTDIYRFKSKTRSDGVSSKLMLKGKIPFPYKDGFYVLQPLI